MSSSVRSSGIGRRVLTLGTGEALSRLLAFGATAYVARRLGADLYGVVALSITIMAYVGRVSDCGVDLLGVHDVARDRSHLTRYLHDYLGARLLVSVVLVVLVVVPALLWFPQPEGAILAGFAFTQLPIALGARWAHLGLENAGLVSVSRTATGLLTALLIIAMVDGPDQLALIAVAYIAGEAIGSYVLLRSLPEVTVRLGALLRVDVVVTLLRRSWPIVLNAILGLVIFNSDFFFLRALRDSATVGFYAAAYTFVSFFINVGHSYSLTLQPVITRLLSDTDSTRGLYHTAAAHVMAGALPIAVGGTLVADRLIPAVFGTRYAPAVLPLQILVWCLPIAVFRNVAQGVLVARGQHDVLIRSAAVAAGSNVVLNLALIPWLGMVGAAVVTIVTEIIRTVPMVRSIRVVGMPLPPPVRFWRPMIAAATMALAISLMPVNSVWLVIVGGAAVYGGSLVLVGGIRFRAGRLPEIVI